MDDGKTCTKCGEWKSYSEYYPRKDSPGKYQHDCKQCRHDANSAFYQANRVAILVREQERNCGAAERAAKQKYDRVYRAANLERRRVTSRARYQANRAAGMLPLRTPEAAQAARERAVAWYAAHPEAGRANARAARLANPDGVRANQTAYRARKLNNGGTFTAAEWQALCVRYGNVCLACGVGGRLTVDHVIPLTCGGRNDIHNIQPLCKPCNSKKHDHIIDYRPDVVLGESNELAG